MSAVERAAEAIGDVWEVFTAGDGERGIRARTAIDIAQALIDAGWHDEPKITDADRAVLDAADKWDDPARYSTAVVQQLHLAVRARREAS